MHSRLLQACAAAYVHDRSMLAGVRQLLTKQSRVDHAESAQDTALLMTRTTIMRCTPS
jgi:hypothetical protein